MKTTLTVLWALAILVLLGIGLKLLRDFVLIPDESSFLSLPPTISKPEERKVNLFFSDQAALTLIPEKRRARMGAGTAVDAGTLVSELIEGPRSGQLLQTLPEGTRLLNAYEVGDIIVLDFTREIQSNHPGGSTSEFLTAYSIINTMTSNLKGVLKVQILVEGEEIQSLAGHVDLTKPLLPDERSMT